MICNDCETVAHCLKNGCVPKQTEVDRLLDEAKLLADDRPVEVGHLPEWTLDAEHTIRRLVKALAEQPAPVQQEPFDPQDYIDPETGEPFNPVEQPAPLLDLDLSTGFTFFDREKGSSFIGEVEMLKWLVENRSKDYWEHEAKERSA